MSQPPHHLPGPAEGRLPSDHHGVLTGDALGQPSADRQVVGSPRRWTLKLLFPLGALTGFCWWQIRLLEDVRPRLEAFYGWFGLASLSYLATLWIVGRISAPSSASTTRRAILPLILVLAGACTFRLLLLNTRPVLSDDIYRYRWDGRVQAAGIDPYAYPPNHPALAFLQDDQFSSINFPRLRTVYPPLTEWAFRLGWWLGPTLTAQKIVFVAAECVTMISVLFILWHRRLNLLWVVAYAWHPLAVLEISGSGHNDALGIAALWVGFGLWETRQWFGVALGWSAAFLSKFLSVVMVPWWCFRRVAQRWLVVFLIIAVLPLALNPTAVSAVYESLSAMTTRFESNASLYVVLTWLTGSSSVARIVAVGVAAGFLLWWSIRQADPIRYVLGALAVLALLSPVLHPWYLVWLIPCFCFWRVPAVMALTLTAVLAYTVWPGRLADGRWVMPMWAHVLEYAPVVLLGVWQLCRSKNRGRFYFFLTRSMGKIEMSPK